MSEKGRRSSTTRRRSIRCDGGRRFGRLEVEAEAEQLRVKCRGGCEVRQMRKSEALLAELVGVLPFFLVLLLFRRRPQVTEGVSERSLLREQHKQWQQPGKVRLAHRLQIMEWAPSPCLFALSGSRIPLRQTPP